VSDSNPFVGPRPFERGELLFGRDREIGELQLRLSAERVVVLHSPSGAGKSSLVQAGLIPLLAPSFDIWGPVRVNAEPPIPETILGTNAGIDPGTNRYVLSVIQRLEESVPAELRQGGESLAGYFEHRPRRKSAPGNVLLIIDQFEEILTVDPLAAEAKHEFFAQLGELLRNPRVWALFALREDYLAPLDPYARQVPTHLKNRFRIDLLSLAAAREAMVEPARQGGREFAAVDELVKDLATVKVQQADGTFLNETGQHVEPVQLQVVCRRLWDAMPAEDLTIDREDLERFGDVTQALAAYYADSVAAAAEGDPGQERAIRDWFGERLIAIGGIRGQVLREAKASGGLANHLIDRLHAAHLVRAEHRAGATWYELSHDRLIEPVARDNAAWQEKFLVDVQKRAALWERQGRPAELLLTGEDLAAGQRWAAESGARITEAERKFLAKSGDAEKGREQERRQARRIRRLAVGASVLSVLALGALFFAAMQWRQTQQALARVYLYEARRLADSGEGLKALGYHALFLRRDPDNSAARGWTCALLFHAAAINPASWLRPEEIVSSGSLSPVGPLLAIAEDARVRSWREAPNQLGEPLDHRAAVVSASFSFDGKRVVTASEDGTAQVWNAISGASVGAPLRHGATVVSASFSSDGKRVVTASKDGTARIWDASLSRPIGPPILLEGDVRSASWSGDGRRVLTAAATAQIWDATPEALGQEIGQPMRHPQGIVTSASFSPDGSRVVTASDDQTARVWDAATGRQVGTSLRHDGAVLVALFSPDGERVLTGSSDHTARVWEAATGRPLAGPLRHDGPVRTAAFNPNGKWVVTGSDDKTARVWDVATGHPLCQPIPHGDPVRFVSFASRWRVVTASGNTVRIWEAATGLPMGEALIHGQTVNTAVFSPDNTRVLTASDDHTARVWDVLFGKVGNSDNLAEVAETIGGYRVTDLGVEPIPAQERVQRLANLRRMAEQAPTDQPTVASFVRWYFTPRFERSVSLQSTMPVEEYIRRLLALGTPEARREAEEAFPGHPLLLRAPAGPGGRQP
jgi:WD40 repeat protein